MFYSHCVGSAIALQIISLLEKADVQVKHYFAAASIPPEKTTSNNPWNYVPDILLKRILNKGGAKLNGLSGEKTTLRLKQFRKDTDFAIVGFGSLCEKIKSPVSIILSKADIFTKNYKDAERIWGKYLCNVTGVQFIDSGSHYFQAENSDELVKMIFDKS